MKQVAQRLRDGQIDVLDVPIPQCGAGSVLVDVRASLLSSGTERTKVQLARKTLVGKARSRPDDVKKVLEKMRSDGVRDTVDAVRLRLAQPVGLGYSAAGVVAAVGAEVSGISIGDRVACAGGGYAMHADLDSVPMNLCTRVPEGVSFEEAAFATVGAIAIHGVRQADARIGERVAVIGLGLVGQLAGQILRAAGCFVIGIDMERRLVDLAIETGAADIAFARDALAEVIPSQASACDAVIITAATASSDPVKLAALLSRDRGRVVVVGDVGMQVPRDAYYEKEIDLRLSRSYGPGRYDRAYEEDGHDYPIGYVRWTERRNMQAVLELIAMKRLNVEPLISRRVRIDDAPGAYDDLASSAASPLGIILEYEASQISEHSPPAPSRRTDSALSVGLIGAGSFAQRVLVPAFRAGGFTLTAVASGSGLSALSAADKLSFVRAESPDATLAASDVDTIVIATRHGLHSQYTCAGLQAGKDVFVEKPPALNKEQLDEIRFALAASDGRLGVGFNRRHARLARLLREHVTASGGPVEVLYRVNAGTLPSDHWLHDLLEGGGRLVGEGCHFIDFACWLVGRLPTTVATTFAPSPDGRPTAAADSFVVSLGFGDGSIATILYGARGASGVGKEYIEAHADGRTGILDDFIRMTAFDGRRRREERDRRRDIGHRAQVSAFAQVLRGEAEPDYPSPLDTMEVTLAAVDAGLTGRLVTPSFPIQAV